ncbi:MAG: hypothetical protein WAM82_23420 [Thermoanaerobaculia bacterium]
MPIELLTVWPGDGALLLRDGLLGRGERDEEEQGEESVEHAADGCADAGDSHRTVLLPLAGAEAQDVDR